MLAVTTWILAAGAFADAQTYSYSYTTEAPTMTPTASLAPTRTETYAPSRVTEAPSYAPTTETYAPTFSGCPPLGYLPPGACPDDATGLRLCSSTGLAPGVLCLSNSATCANTPATGCPAAIGARRRLRGSDADDPAETCKSGCVVACVLEVAGEDPFAPTAAPTAAPRSDCSRA